MSEPDPPQERSVAEREAERHRARRSARLSLFRRIRRRLPHRANVDRYPVVRWFAGAARRRPYLWSFQAGEVRRAIYVGTVIAFLPVYGLQILLAFWAAVLLRANLPITCALQFLTNPVTAGPIYLLAYRLGMAIIGGLAVGEGLTPMGTRINALILGGVLLGLAAALLLDGLFRLAAWEARWLRERHRRAEEAVAADRRPDRGGDGEGPGAASTPG